MVAGRPPLRAGQRDFALARYNPDGSLDATFNASGKVLTNIGGFDSANALAIQSDGKIVAAGFSDASGTRDFALARTFRRTGPNAI